MSSSTCYNGCNGHGTCQNAKCLCDLGWFLSNATKSCEKNLMDSAGPSWEFFIIFFTLLFIFTFLYTSFKLYLSINQEKTFDCKLKLFRAFKTPKNISLLGILFISFLRIFWLNFDPMGFKGIANRMEERFLFNLAYPILFTVWASVLVVWSGLYEGIRKKKRDPFKYIRKLIIVLMFLSYPLTFMIIINQGLRQDGSLWSWIGYISVSIGSCFVSIWYIIYATLLVRYIKSHNNDIPIPQPICFQLVPYYKKNYANKEKRLLDMDEWIDIISVESPQIVSKASIEKMEPDLKLKTINDKYFLQLTKEDKSIICKLLIITLMSGIAGFVIIFIWIPFFVSDSFNSVENVYAGLFVGFVLELGACILIIVTFTTQIKVPEKENIKNMVFMARAFRNTEPKFQLSSKFKHISKRLRLYYS